MNHKNTISALWMGLLLCSFSTAPRHPVNIVFIGDSITYGVFLNKTPPMDAYHYLVHQKGIGHVAIFNQGVSGYTTVNFLPATGTVFAKAEQAANALSRKNPGTLIFSIMLGTNDSAEDGPTGSPVSPAAYRGNMKAIIDRLLQDYPHCRVIVNYPIWYSPDTYNSARYLQAGLTRLQSYFPEIDSLVTAYGPTDPGRVFGGDRKVFDDFRIHYRALYKPQSGHEGIFYLHPNARGAKKLGTYWGKAIYRAVFP